MAALRFVKLLPKPNQIDRMTMLPTMNSVLRNSMRKACAWDGSLMRVLNRLLAARLVPSVSNSTINEEIAVLNRSPSKSRVRACVVACSALLSFPSSGTP